MSRIRVSLDLNKLAEYLAYTLSRDNRRYLTVDGLARSLGVSTRTAGRILSKLEAMGKVSRYSRRAYMLRVYV